MKSQYAIHILVHHHIFSTFQLISAWPHKSGAFEQSKLATEV